MKLLLASASVVLVSASANPAHPVSGEPNIIDVDNALRQVERDEEEPSAYVWRTDAVKDDELMGRAVALQAALTTKSREVRPEFASMLSEMFDFLVGSHSISPAQNRATKMRACQWVVANTTLFSERATWEKFKQLEQELKGKRIAFRVAWRNKHGVPVSPHGGLH